ncbi:DUF2982 domain-containing protein [Coleofasciculus sp. FACHB-64]|uniref:STM3941 family protein n=1 Tax=Cyanophyceae TaxID=3028117 RepID=UPI001681D766|nr:MULTISPECIES: STM3941 family protein [unclassified Coleofasciculus]MBD1838965.1 DUF2982 domain-containing protein [Coleofasciculus sp. FACHB-501]MBD2048479.1 DUF2982 domain-containing protein [Coleofasciculus sp. FACHB-64]
MTVPERFEVKPNSQQNAILLAVSCTVFSIIGLFMMGSGQPKAILGGVLGVVFFGGGGIVTVPKLLKRPVSIVLTREGLQQITLYGKSILYWRDIESVGIARLEGTKLVGLRLKNYDNYINNMSPELVNYWMNSLPYLKLLSFGTLVLEVPLDVPSFVKIWSVLKGHPNPVNALKSFGKVGNLVEAMLWSRQTYGYDILLSWADLDRSASEFIELLEQYRKAFTT